MGSAEARTSKYSLQKSRQIRNKMKDRIQLSQALALISNGKYEKGVQKLFMMSKSATLKKRRTEIRYELGKALVKMKLFHVASFQFLSVIQSGNSKFAQRALAHLSEIASLIGNSQMIQFAVENGGAQKVKGAYRYSLYYYWGKHELSSKKYRKAAIYFKKIPKHSPLYSKAQYHLGLSYAERKRTRRATDAFKNILSKTSKVTDSVRVAALMGIARVYYQAKRWDLAIQYYRRIPRDTPEWHDMLFESSWALLRGGKFRSAMNSFLTLHSDYYDKVYQPGSLLLRGIIYMYICKYSEMEKVLSLFKITYQPLYKKVNRILSSSSQFYYANLTRSLRSSSNSFPPVIANRISREYDFELLNRYVRYLQSELRVIQGRPQYWRASQIGRYSENLVEKYLKRAQSNINKNIKQHLLVMKSELRSLLNQEKYLRYESLRGKRELLKRKIKSKHFGNVQITASTSRDYFIQNGFEYYPFQGEYWLDELGNYHYVGSQNCRP